MDFRIELSAQADDDINQIIRYIHEELNNPQAAENFYKELGGKIDLLREQPYMYPLSRDDKLRTEGYRSVVVGKFLMFYRVEEARSAVGISRILYGKRDIFSAFTEHPVN